MNTFNVSSVILSLMAACALSCVNAGDSDIQQDAPKDRVVEPNGVEAVPAYFNYDNRYFADDDANWIYARFNAYAGRRITVALHQRPGAEEVSIGLKLYALSSDGTLQLMRAIDSDWGGAVYTFDSGGSGAYVVEMASSGHLYDLALRLSCDGDQCSPDPQPNALCGGLAGIPCAEGFFCAYAPEASCGAFDRGGLCAVKPAQCSHIFNPVCGCDGRTYGSVCAAASAGVSVKSEGQCGAPVAHVGESCGGFRRGPAPTCAQGLYCNYDPGAFCGRADAPGTCAERPASCSEEGVPVCGCDGLTYASACQAALNGVSAEHDGACPSGSTN